MIPAYESAFGRPPNNAEVTDIATMAANLGLDGVIHRAITMAALNGANSVPAYVRTIAKDWHFQRIKTEAELDEYLFLSDCASGKLMSINPSEEQKRISDLREARMEAEP